MLWCHPAVARSLAAEIGTVLLDPTRHRLKDADIETAAFALGILPEHVLAGLSWPNVTKLAEVAVRATGDDYAPQKKLNVLTAIAKGAAPKSLRVKGHPADDGYLYGDDGNRILTRDGRPMTSDIDLAWVRLTQSEMFWDAYTLYRRDPAEATLAAQLNRELSLWHAVAGARITHGPAIASPTHNKSITEPVGVFTEGRLVLLLPHEVAPWLDTRCPSWRKKYKWMPSLVPTRARPKLGQRGPHETYPARVGAHPAQSFLGAGRKILGTPHTSSFTRNLRN